MDEIKIKVWVATWMAGSKYEVTIKMPREEWEEMDEDERADICYEEAINNLEWGYEVAD